MFDQDPGEQARISASDFAQMCDEMNELREQRDAALTLAGRLRDALKKCAGVCSGEAVNKNGLIDALECAKSALTKAKEVLP